MRLRTFPTRTLIFLLLAFSCPILATAAPVPRETIERLAQLNVERGEIQHLNAIGKLTDGEYNARKKTLDQEAYQLWETFHLITHNTREETAQADSTVAGLSRGKLSLMEPGWRKEEAAYREAQGKRREDMFHDVDRSAKQAAQIQKQRLALKEQLEKGSLDRGIFNEKDRQLLTGIEALRNKNEPTGRPGLYFDERLTYYTSRIMETPKPSAPVVVKPKPVFIPYQPPPPVKDYAMFYWLGGGAGLLIVIFWLASLGEKEQAPAGPTPTGIHGTAAWSDCEYMTTAWDTVARGVHFGQSSSPQYRNAANHPATAPITSRPENHTLIVARTRAGKGTGVIIPTLLRCQDSMLIIDPKGENAAITARIRRDQLGHQIHIINPWDQLTHIYKKLGFETATFNPLDAIDRNDPNAVALAQSMAGIICPPPQGKENPYWQGSAANILSSVFLWLAETLGEKNTLVRAHEIVTQTRADFIKDLAKMASSKAFQGAIKRGVSQYLDLAPETYSNIISTLSENTRFLLDSQITASTETSSFSMKDLRDKYLTVYLVIPHDYIKIHSKWLRLIIASAMQSLKSRNRLPDPPHHRCMFLIDEFGSMGHMPDMPTDIAVMSGFGLDFTLVLQNLGQLQKNYGEDSKTILSNCGYQWFCYIKELETAKYISECLGKKTVVTVGTGKTIGATQAGQTEGSSTTYGETGRSLLNPDEVLNLGQKVAILMHPYGPPHYLRPVAYSKLTETYAQFKNLCAHFYWNPPLDYDRNPYVKNSGKPPDPPPATPPTNWMPTLKKEASKTEQPPQKPTTPPTVPPPSGTPESLHPLFRFSQQKPGTPEEYERQRKWLNEAFRANNPTPPKPPPPPKPPMIGDEVFTDEDIAENAAREAAKAKAREMAGADDPPPFYGEEVFPPGEEWPPPPDNPKPPTKPPKPKKPPKDPNAPYDPYDAPDPHDPWKPK